MDTRFPEPDVSLVHAMVARQFPEWAGLEIRPVNVSGWDNRTFHLGDTLLVRIPHAQERIVFSGVRTSVFMMPKHSKPSHRLPVLLMLIWHQMSGARRLAVLMQGIQFGFTVISRLGTS